MTSRRPFPHLLQAALLGSCLLILAVHPVSAQEGRLMGYTTSSTRVQNPLGTDWRTLPSHGLPRDVAARLEADGKTVLVQQGSASMRFYAHEVVFRLAGPPPPPAQSGPGPCPTPGRGGYVIAGRSGVGEGCPLPAQGR